MLLNQWQEIESLYHSACKLKPEERSAYLDRACGSDHAIRQEVESLLDYDDLAASFLETDDPSVRSRCPEEPVPNGERIGPYVLLQFLQAGGMGEVYKAWDNRLDRNVAIKFLPRAFASEPIALERFQREARAASALNHARICTIHDWGEHQGRPFFVMEFLEGQSLRERIGHEALPIPELVDLSIQICDALETAHAKGIVHRDIKPANIFITTGGQIKILDFGLAKRGVESSSSATALRKPAKNTQTLSLTATGNIMGTLAYMSPEQTRGENVDARTDLFSLGAVLYEMATGRPPFRGKTAGELVAAILYERPEKPSLLNPAVRGSLDRIILRALEKDCATRYQSAAVLESDLRQSSAVRKTRRWLLSSSAAGVLALGGGALLTRPALFGEHRKIRVAVLPLNDPGTDPKQDYFAASLHQQMIKLLGRLYPDRLGVIAPESVKRYRGANVRLDQVGRDLNVDYVVEGDVRRPPNRVRISARLTRIKDRAQLWNASFERDMAHILSLQAEVAQAVAQGIEHSLRPNPQVQLTLSRPLDPEAYEAFLRGDFAKSIQLDPYYAPAYIGLAWKLYIPALWGITPPQPAFNQMLEAASKAVELDGTSADARVTLATARLHTQWKWREAENGFRQAVQLEPNNPDVRHGFAHFLLSQGRGVESAEQCNIAQDLDPFDPGLMACRGWHDLWAGEYDQAIASAQRALSFQRDNGFALLVIGWAYEQKRMFPEAISALEKSATGDPLNSSVAHVLALSGNRQAAEDILARKLEESGKKYVSPYNIAVIYMGLGRVNDALAWLTKAYNEHSGFMVYVYLDPRFKPLRRDPRFQALLQRMGFTSREA